MISQLFLMWSKVSVCEIWAALARFLARFSFRDAPDFLVMVCRGDLSDIAALLIWGPELVPVSLVYTPSTRVAPTYPRGYKYQTPLTAMSAGRRCRKAAISTESSMPEGT
jgi:hypothetical protein